MKFRFEQKAETTTLDLYIYDDIEGDTFSFWDVKHESKTSSEYFRKQLENYPNVQEINVYINSMGGDVFEAYGICSQLDRCEAKVNVIVDGFACSAASLLLCIADKVTMSSQSMVMIHNMWTVAIGNAFELRKAADDIEKIMEGNRTLYLRKMKVTEEELIKMLDAETYLTAKECVEYGLCDEINGETKADTMNQVLELSEKNMKMKLAQLRMMKQSIEDLTQKNKTKKEEFDSNSMLSFFEQF